MRKIVLLLFCVLCASCGPSANLVQTAIADTEDVAPTRTKTPSSKVPPTQKNSPTSTRTPLLTSTGTQTPTATKTPTRSVTGTSATADVIFADGFERGNLDAWSASVVGGGDLSVSADAALIGSWGLRATLNDNEAIFVTEESRTSERRYRARFYFDPNTIGMASGDAHFIFQGYGLSGTIATAVMRVEFGYSSSNYQLRMAALSDNATWVNTAWVTL